MVERKLLELLAGLAATTLEAREVKSFDLNDNEDRQQYHSFLDELINRGYEVVASTREDGSYGYSEVKLLQNTVTHSSSVDEPTWYLIDEGSNDTGDWWATVYAIF